MGEEVPPIPRCPNCLVRIHPPLDVREIGGDNTRLEYWCKMCREPYARLPKNYQPRRDDAHETQGPH
jgi:hypothetical protein